MTQFDKAAETRKNFPLIYQLLSYPRPLRLAIAVLLLLPFPAALGWLIYGASWLPSQQWLLTSKPIATVAGFTLAACPVWVIIMDHKMKGRDANGEPHPFKTGFLGLITFLACYYFGADLVRSTLPAIHAQMTGHEVEHAYVVRQADGGNRKLCSRPTELENMPFLTALCGVSEDFRRKLRPGMEITVRGNGTWWGVFPRQVSFTPTP